MATVTQTVEQSGVERGAMFGDARFTGLTRFCYALLITAIVIFAAVRFHLRNMPLDRDSGEYAYMGQLMLQGIPPYKLAANMKLPGTYAAYAAIMAVFGETPAGIYTGVIVVTSLSAFLLFLIGKRLYGPLAGAVAGASFIFFAARPAVLGLEGQATHFVDVTALAGIFLLLRAMPGTAKTTPATSSNDWSRIALFFASGLCFGLSFLMKQPGIFFGIFAGLYWLWREWKRPILWTSLVRGGAISFGALLPYALTCLVLLKAGVFENFWFWTWTYARAYGLIATWSQGWSNLRLFLPWAVRPFVLWAIALLGLLAPLWSSHARRHGGFLAGFFLTSFLTVCPGFYFRPHYFITLLPAGALCIGVAIESAYIGLRCRGFHRLALLPLALFALAWLTSVYGQWKRMYRLDPVAVSWRVWKEQDFPTDVTIAQFIKSRAAAGDEIGIIGSEPEICFYARLHCATSYLYTYPMMEKQPFAKQMQDDFLRQLESKRPRFLIYEDNERAWGWKLTLTENQAFFDRAWAFAHSGYTLINETPARYLGVYPEHLWGARGAFYVFERVHN